MLNIFLMLYIVYFIEAPLWVKVLANIWAFLKLLQIYIEWNAVKGR